MLSRETVRNGARKVVSLATDRAEATPEGGAEIRQRLRGIRSPCMAPFIVVTSAAGSWFVVSGF